MINRIIDGIVASLNKEFGDEYELYPEEIEQGLKEPCFSIVCINPKTDQVLGKRYFKSNSFCIHYFSKSKNEAKNEINRVVERLFDCLEYIDVDGDLCRGTNFYAELSEGVLHFFVNYDLFVYKNREKTSKMEIHKYKTSVKG